MRQIYFILIVLLASTAIFLPTVSSQLKSDEDSSSKKTEPAAAILARERGFPRVSFEDGKDLSAAGANDQNAASAKLLTSADFDSDGTPDLVTADAGGQLKFYRGDADSIYPYSADAQRRKEAGTFTGAAFHLGENSVFISISPDFLFAGDFNADGRQDIVAARRNDRAVHFLAGDGAGNFAGERLIRIDGQITALTAGEIGRRDGQTDLAIAVADKNGARLLVFEHPEGAFKHQPEIIRLPSPANDLAIGNLDTDFYADIAAASGNKLTIIRGRGQAYPWDLLAEYDIKRPKATLETRVLPFEIAALETGNFTDNRGESLAILTTNGTIETLDAPKTENRNPNSKIQNLNFEGLFVPAEMEASQFAVIKNKLANGTGNFENSDLLPANSVDREKVLRERSEKLAADLKKLSAEEKARMNAEALRRAEESRERAKRGFLQTIAPAKSAPLALWNRQTVISDARLASAASSPNAHKIVKVRVSNSGKDELALLDTNAGQIHLLAQNSKSGEQKSPTELITFESATAPTAILPVRLNADAISDLIVLRENSAQPAIVLSSPANTFVVNTNDNSNSGLCDGTEPCSLRRAINLANQSPDADFISFNIAGGGLQTITPDIALPDIVTPVTIDGTTQPGFAGLPLIEIKGANVVEGKDGLRINAPNVVVRGLAINEFKSEPVPNSNSFRGGNGITVFNFANSSFVRNAIIEGNFLGTDAGGTLDKGNEATGLLIFDSDSNTVGGATAAARNVMSGNGDANSERYRRAVGLSVTVGNNNQIKGNYIGTNASGTSAIANSYGVFFSGANNQFGGDEAGAGNVVSGNGEISPFIPGNTCVGVGVSEETLVNTSTLELLTLNNTYKGNRIGTNANGTAALGNCRTGLVTSPLHTATVGSITETGRNIVSGNKYDGIYCSWAAQGEEAAFAENMNLGGIEQFPPGFCGIAGNNVGMDITGSVAVPNTIENDIFPAIRFRGAVVVYNTETLSYVGAPGGTTADACTGFCNLISGNTDVGIDRESGLGTVGIFNNYVGTDRTGTTGRSNYEGIINFTSAGNTHIFGNLVSGNRSDGIRVQGFYEHLIQGNLIGTDRTGTNAIPNSNDVEGGSFALYVSGGSIIIGGDDASSRNIIAGNTKGGIFISNVLEERITGNYIGVNLQGMPLGNGRDGVFISGDNIKLGGDSFAEANIIAHNGGNGVYVLGVNNSIRFNSIYSNGMLGIDLPSVATDGEVTPNDCLDADEGPNRLQNFPVLTTPVFNGTVTVGGALQTEPLGSYTLDFYASATADPTNYGEGETYIGSKIVQTDNSGVATFAFTSTAPVASNMKITATATDANGNTSEFSCAAGECTGGTGGLSEEDLRALVAPTCLVPIIVNIDTDEPDANSEEGICDVNVEMPGSQCSLRAAIETANANNGFDLINFDIPGGGVQTISPSSALPDIIGKTFIDATSQTGYAPNAPTVELNGAGAGAANGLTIRASGVTIAGFVINRFSGVNNETGNGIFAENVDNLKIQSCFIGTNAAGTSAAPNQHKGILFRSVSDSRIGGDDADFGNLISGNGGSESGDSGIGIEITASNPNFNGNNRIIGNRIGVDKTGANVLTNKSTGILIGNSNGNEIGGETDTPGTTPGNVIAGQSVFSGTTLETASTGIALVNANDNRIQGNTIGTNAAGTSGFSNGIGVSLLQSANNLIGGDSPATRNIISANLAEGVFISGLLSTENSVSGNYIGTDITGQAQVPTQGAPANVTHQLNGVILSATKNNRVGGSSEGERNVIAGNLQSQVHVEFIDSEDNQISGNYVGLFADGTTAPVYPDVQAGILITGARRTIVGGSSSGMRNVISGNRVGVLIRNDENSADAQQKILGNYIGTTAEGSAALGNTLGGVVIIKSSGNQIGGAGASERNIISGNGGTGGITLTNEQPPPSPLNFAEFSGRAFSPANARERLQKIISAKLEKPVTSAANNLVGETKNNRIINNYIGLSADGQTNIPNTPAGVVLTLGASENIVGGTSVSERNVISGNTNFGVFIGNFQQNAASPSANRISGNIIGLNPDASEKLPNGAGIGVLFGANNIIGGETAEAGNTISGNNSHGILLDATSNTIRFNTIGTNTVGALNLGNTGDGIRFSNVQENDNTIADNTIAGNGGSGVFAGGAGGGSPIFSNTKNPNRALFNLKFIGNKIGIKKNAGVSVRLPNLGSGIEIQNLAGAFIGEPDQAKNIIAGNAGAGIRITGAASTGNKIANSFIGTDDLLTQNLGNGSHGILITDQSGQNIVGGTEENSGNTITGNGGAGVRLEETAGTGNLVDPNVIFGNTGLGIDLGSTGRTLNDLHDTDAGANNLQNYPQITSKQIVNNELIVKFLVDSSPAHADYGALGIYVEFFKADASGEGERFLGFGYYTVSDYNGGSPLMKTINLGNLSTLGITASDPITATASDAAGNTSEFTPLAPPVTAASVAVGGRAVTANGGGIFKARISITGADGATRTALTNAYGYYEFRQVEVGQTYIISAQHKTYQFQPPTRVLSVTEQLSAVDFTASP